MLPELFKLPVLGIPLSTYGLLQAVTFVVALWVAVRLGAADGLPKIKVYYLGIFLCPVFLLGAKLLMILTEWNTYGGDWHQGNSFVLLRSVGAYYGGLLTCLAVSPFLMRALRLPWRRTVDACAPGIALGGVTARLGCFAGGCCWGKPTDLWFGVNFTEKAHELTGVPIGFSLVPIQLIEAGVYLLIFALLLWVRKRRTFTGQVFIAFMMLYSVARFFTEFWRDDPRGQVLGLSTSQFISAMLFPLALAFYYRIATRLVGKSTEESAVYEPLTLSGARGQPAQPL
jgi:phosphatidylglycerol---prolipoprotein diacylglyceryl transferase